MVDDLRKRDLLFVANISKTYGKLTSDAGLRNNVVETVEVVNDEVFAVVLSEESDKTEFSEESDKTAFSDEFASIFAK